MSHPPPKGCCYPLRHKDFVEILDGVHKSQVEVEVCYHDRQSYSDKGRKDAASRGIYKICALELYHFVARPETVRASTYPLPRDLFHPSLLERSRLKEILSSGLTRLAQPGLLDPAWRVDFFLLSREARAEVRGWRRAEGAHEENWRAQYELA